MPPAPVPAPQRPAQNNNHIGEVLAVVGVLLFFWSLYKTESEPTFGSAVYVPFIYLGFFMVLGGGIKAFFDHYQAKDLRKFLLISVVILVIVFVLAAHGFGWT